MKSNIKISPLTKVSELPRFNPERPNIRPYSAEKYADLHYEDGWRDYLRPVFDSETQRLGELFFDEERDIVTNEVINIPIQEIEERQRNNALSQAENLQEELLQQKLRNQIIEQVQEIEDDSEALENQPLFPIWETLPDGYPFERGKKYQSFEGSELKLFRVIQAHNKQSDRIPVNVPALLSKIEIGDGGIEIWTQPIGGDGKYPYKDPLTDQPYRVIFENQIWENNFQGGLNVWKPGEFGWTLIGNV